MKLLSTYSFIILCSVLTFMGCTSKVGQNVADKKGKPKVANIDLSHWKVTIPAANDKGKPIDVGPPELQNYATNEVLKPYMYNDSTDGSIVFYAYPSGVSTANSSYSRSELREQMVPGENNVNWTFAQGGKMRGTLSVPEITTDSKGKKHKVIIMQIHGRLTNEQRDLIGQKDNNAPPILKIYWEDGRVRVKTKVLRDFRMEGKDILETSAWTDDEGFYFTENVGRKKFTLEVTVSAGKMKIQLNDRETVTYDGVHIEKWGVFENYFKAGNYFNSKDEGSYARVKYYELEVSH